jgi:FMN phosphatase YigB (HAD superfamily)
MKHYLQAARRSIQQHGGGISGLLSVLRRALRITSAMGIRVVLARLRSASAVRTRVADVFDETPLPAPAPISTLDLRVGVMAHVFYPDLIEEFVGALQHMPVPYVLLVSVIDNAAAEQVQAQMSKLPKLLVLQVKIVENRGRDIAPLLVAFHEEILELDVVSHIHTKKSLYTGSEQGSWRRYLLDRLFGSPQRIAWILGMFQATPKLGLVYPESHETMPVWGHTWLSNAAVGDALAARLGITLEHSRYLDFPAGWMFWARVDALRPLFDLRLRVNEFPPEQGQTDGTLQHAIERMFALVARQQGFRLGILPADGCLDLASEGLRNIFIALETTIAERIQLSAAGALTVSVDIFDTLVVRPFLTPAASRAHLAWQLDRRYGIKEFFRLREDAETALRTKLQRDPTLREIHRQISKQLKHAECSEEELIQAELEHERRQLRPRTGVLAALQHLESRKLFALSDMYLDSGDLKQVLPPSVNEAIPKWWVSCETGLRKDQRRSWPELARRTGIDSTRWLHIGDNECSDVQLPQSEGLLTPVHILRPAALLDLLPALRALRHPQGADATWPEQLWRGLLANRFASILDVAPQRLHGSLQLDPADLGYVVLGPLLLDFLLSMVRSAGQHNVGCVLFLSREGHLLHRAFERLQVFHPGARKLQSHYFLASRRATALPAMHTSEDLGFLLAGTFNGTLEQLLLARAGEAAIHALVQIEPGLLQRDVFLPEMAETVSGWLQPVLPALLAEGVRARAHYLAYWSSLSSAGGTMVVDLGYAGTIQRNLAHMRQCPLGGYYMALRQGASQLQLQNWAEARYFDGRIHEAESSSAILTNDLLLEALLGAPAGQFNGFEATEAHARQPCFGPIELSEAGLQTLGRMHQGALDFIDDACAMIGEDIADIELDAAGVQIPLQCVASGRWKADATLQLLVTDDSFTGRGRIAAACKPVN